MRLFPKKTSAPEAPAAAPASPGGALGPKPKVVGPTDAVLTSVLVGLVAFGVVMVYSASAVYANRMFDDGYHYLVRQAIYAGLGLTVMFVAAGIDYHRYRLLTYPILAVTVGLLLVVALGLGRSAGGAARWIQVGPINIQPSEVAKLAILFWLAYSLSKKRDRIQSFSVGFLPHVLMAGFLMLLCLEQPDFGSAVMIGLLTFVLLFTAGTRLRDLLGAVAAALPVLVLLVVTSEYRLRRIQAFLHPEADRKNTTYQIYESLVSFGSGGLTGVGIGDGRQKLFFLPEAHTDFIGAIVGEELGFIGICALLVAFSVVVVRGLRAAFHAADDYGGYLAVGISLFFGLQAFTNLAVAMGLLPTKGLVLPFISYGGSSLLVNCAAAGVLLNVSRPRAVEGAQEDTGVTARASAEARSERASGPAAALGGMKTGGAARARAATHWEGGAA
jgi:cell division protein FtsW